MIHLHLCPLVFIIYKFAPLIESIKFKFSPLWAMVLQKCRLRPLVLDVLVSGDGVVLLLRWNTLDSIGVIFWLIFGCLRPLPWLVVGLVALGPGILVLIRIVDICCRVQTLAITWRWSLSAVLIYPANVLWAWLRIGCRWSVEISYALGGCLLRDTIHLLEQDSFAVWMLDGVAEWTSNLLERVIPLLVRELPRIVWIIALLRSILRAIAATSELLD